MKAAFLLGVLFGVLLTLLLALTCYRILRWATRKVIERQAKKEPGPERQRLLAESLRVTFRERCLGCKTRTHLHSKDCPTALQLAHDIVTLSGEDRPKENA